MAIPRGAVVVSLALHALAWVSADPGLTPHEWERLRGGEIITRTERREEGGAAAWSVGLIDHDPELVWRAVCNPQLFERYIKSIPRSLLLDEATVARVAALGDVHPDAAELAFRDAPPGGWRREPDGRWTAWSYQRARFPWPLRDRWVVIRIVADDSTMTQVWERVAGTMTDDRGSWSVREAPGGKTLLTNEMQVRLPGAAFDLFTPVAMTVSVRETYRSLHRLASDLVGVTPSCSECPGLSGSPPPRPSR